MLLVLFLLASIGLSHILVESTVCDPIRKWFKDRAPKPDKEPERFSGSWVCGKISYILGCYQCSGVWSGWVVASCLLGTWNVDATLISNTITNLAIILPAGFAASVASNFAATLFTYLEANSMIK